MAKCTACGKGVLIPTKISNISLCKECAQTINLSKWEKRDCGTIEELIAHRNYALQMAAVYVFSEEAIRSLENYFNEYIDAGYVTTIDGKAGQMLRIFEEFCIIETKSESKKQQLGYDFCYLIDGDDDGDNDEDINDREYAMKQTASIAKGILSGRLIQTGIGVATTAAAHSKEKEVVAKRREKAKERRERERQRIIDNLITVGQQTVFLEKIEQVDTYHKQGLSFGYLRFVPQGVSTTDNYNCIYFFYNNSIPLQSKKIKQRIEEIRELIDEKVSDLKLKQIQTTELKMKEVYEKQLEKLAAENQLKQDSFEEIRKYKALLDEGIITEEEFNQKKKELLGI